MRTEDREAGVMDIMRSGAEALGMNREVKATVFSDLFKIKKYLFQLYRTLHPEDTTTVEDDLTLYFYLQ